MGTDVGRIGTIPGDWYPMWPAVSAYTRFCEGTANLAAAARNSVKLPAVFIAKIASAVVLGTRPVQASETAYVSCCGTSRTSAFRPTRPTESMTSETIGPCTVRRIFSWTSLPRPP